MKSYNIHHAVACSLQEDLGCGDITSSAVGHNHAISARVITRECAVVAGRPWFDAVYTQIDPQVRITWHVQEGLCASSNTVLLTLHGPASSILSGERVALNWLQMISGVATRTRHCVQALNGTSTRLRDTRKTLPGLRDAQKYAVRCGGGMNHRMGLYDAYLIKENHILACGSLSEAIARVRAHPVNAPLEVEVETVPQLQEALDAGVDLILLDNFTEPQIKEAVFVTKGRAQLEVSGNIDLEKLARIAQTGVDFIAMGSITKNIQAIDLSMRFFE